MLELSSLTKLLGVSIISRDEVDGNVTHDIQNTKDPSITKEMGTESINGIQVRAGALKIVDICREAGAPPFVNCSMWTGNEFCGELKLDEDILPLREYKVMCKKAIFANFISIQLPTQDGVKRSLTFEEVSVIRGNFRNKEKIVKIENSQHGSAGELKN